MIGLAKAGWDVAFTYRQDEEAARAVDRHCETLGRRSIGARVDVTVETEVVAFFALVGAQLGPLRALVNNAGIVAPATRFADLTVERIERIFAVNVTGSFVAAREAVRRMSTANGGAGGVIVNLSSAASRLGSPGEYVDYAASKGAIDTMTLGLAKEVAAEGIRVNAIRPGVIETDIHASGGEPGRVARIAPMVPMQRGGTADEVAAAVVWLCSDAASYVTGAVLDVAGGR